MFTCKKCDDPIVAADYIDHVMNFGQLPAETEDAKTSELCCECFLEIVIGELPFVTDSRIPPNGTGLTMRQQMGKRRTDGG